MRGKPCAALCKLQQPQKINERSRHTFDLVKTMTGSRPECRSFTSAKGIMSKSLIGLLVIQSHDLEEDPQALGVVERRGLGAIFGVQDLWKQRIDRELAEV